MFLSKGAQRKGEAESPEVSDQMIAKDDLTESVDFLSVRSIHNPELEFYCVSS